MVVSDMKLRGFAFKLGMSFTVVTLVLLLASLWVQFTPISAFSVSTSVQFTVYSHIESHAPYSPNAFTVYYDCTVYMLDQELAEANSVYLKGRAHQLFSILCVITELHKTGKDLAKIMLPEKELPLTIMCPREAQSLRLHDVPAMINVTNGNATLVHQFWVDYAEVGIPDSDLTKAYISRPYAESRLDLRINDGVVTAHTIEYKNETITKALEIYNPTWMKIKSMVPQSLQILAIATAFVAGLTVRLKPKSQ